MEMKWSPRQQKQSRLTQLDTEFSSWMTEYRDIARYLTPRRGRFIHTDRNKGGNRQHSILDSTGTYALHILQAGMMSGATSPARPWFRLAIPDKDLMDYGPVKIWLNDVTLIMRDIFARSNTYRTLPGMYRELGAFGTAADFVDNNFDNVIHHHAMTIGEYRISTDDLGYVDTLYRKFDMTVAQVVRKFGYENCSMRTRNLWDNFNYDAWVTIVHATEPRRERNPKKRDAVNMPYSSCYFEEGTEEQGKPFLSESGFEEFPFLVPRWDVIGGDIMGSGPGSEALGDLQQLQHEQMRKGQGIDFQTRPPMQASGQMKGNEANMLPGGVTYFEQAGQGVGLSPAFQSNLRLDYLLQDIEDVRGRIKQCFHSDLFLMLANDNRSNITAREIAERHEEKLTMLGPVLERLHDEMLSPLIDITFSKMVRANILPPPPEELQGMDLNVEFVSMLAQAMRAAGIGSIDRLLGTVGAVMQMKPDAIDKVDTDTLIDKYGDMLGVDPDLIVANDEVAIIRQNRAQAQAQAQQMAAAQQMATTAKTMSETNTDGNNALTQVAGQMQGA